MEINYAKGVIELKNKILNDIDKFVLEFTSILEKIGIKYVLVSGYIPLIFGRSRMTEDVDIFIEEIGFTKYKELWKELNREYGCHIPNLEESYNDYLMKGSALRFNEKGKFIPNMEVKFPKNELQTWALNNKLKLILNDRTLYISNLELQISYKLYMGSDKDIEDARFLYKLFKNYLNKEKLNEFNRKFQIEHLFKKYIG